MMTLSRAARRQPLVWHGRTLTGDAVRFVLPDPANADRFHLLLDARAPGPEDVHEVAVVPWPVDPLLALRLVEAGVHHVAPPGSFVCHDLADRLALRRRLGLRADGDTTAFLREVAEVPDPWWLDDSTAPPGGHLADDVARICRAAVDVAGMRPTPDGPPGATAVRQVVRRLWGVTLPQPAALPAGAATGAATGATTVPTTVPISLPTTR